MMQGRPRCKPATYKIYTDFDQVPVLMTIQDTANFLNMRDRTVLNYIHENIIEAFKVGKEWRIPKEQWRYQNKKFIE